MGVDAWRRSMAEAGEGATVGVVAIPRMKHLPTTLAARNPTRPPAVVRRAYDGCSKPMAFQPIPFSLSATPPVAVDPPPMRGAHTREMLAAVGIDVPQGTGVTPYPPDPPLLPWLWNVARWGWFAYRWGNI
jgi:hypothetical protein